MNSLVDYKKKYLKYKKKYLELKAKIHGGTITKSGNNITNIPIDRVPNGFVNFIKKVVYISTLLEKANEDTKKMIETDFALYIPYLVHTDKFKKFLDLLSDINYSRDKFSPEYGKSSITSMIIPQSLSKLPHTSVSFIKPEHHKINSQTYDILKNVDISGSIWVSYPFNKDISGYWTVDFVPTIPTKLKSILLNSTYITDFSKYDGTQIMDIICLEDEYTLIYKWSTDKKSREEQISIKIKTENKVLIWDIELPKSAQVPAQAPAKLAQAPTQAPAKLAQATAPAKLAQAPTQTQSTVKSAKIQATNK